MNKKIQSLIDAGWMTRKQMIETLGITGGGHLSAWAKRNHVHEIQIPMGGGNRCRRLYWRADVERVAVKKEHEHKPPRFGGFRIENNVPVPNSQLKQTALDLDEIESEVDDKKWRAGVDAKLARILAALGELLSYFEEADAADCET